MTIDDAELLCQDAANYVKEFQWLQPGPWIVSDRPPYGLWFSYPPVQIGYMNHLTAASFAATARTAYSRDLRIGLSAVLSVAISTIAECRDEALASRWETVKHLSERLLAAWIEERL